MITFIIKLLLKIASSKAAEQLVAIGVNKLLDSTKGGINKDLAKTMINGIAESKQNPTTKDVFQTALESLGKSLA